MQPKISVVIPIYNVEKYLHQCMDSIINQTFTDIEILAVNDGSIDSCLSILLDYQKKDSRVKVINKKNGGLGDTRQTGFNATTGKYVMFIDGDDWLETNALDKMYRIAEENNLDVVITQIMQDYPTYSKLWEIHIDKDCVLDKDQHGNIVMRKLIGTLPEEYNYQSELNSACNKLYRIELLRTHNITFVSEREYYGEDLIYNLNVFMYAKKYIVLSDAFYHYRRNLESSLTGVYRPEKCEMSLKMFKYISDLIDKQYPNDKDMYYMALYGKIHKAVPNNLMYLCRKENKSPISTILKDIKAYIKTPIIEKALKEYKPAVRLSLRKRLQYMLLKSGFALPVYLYGKSKEILDKLQKH